MRLGKELVREAGRAHILRRSDEKGKAAQNRTGNPNVCLDVELQPTCWPDGAVPKAIRVENPITLLAPKEETSGRRVQPAFYLRDGAVPLLVEKLS